MKLAKQDSTERKRLAELIEPVRVAMMTTVDDEGLLVSRPMSPLEMPAYPAQALNSGVVLMELNVAAQGGINGAKVLKSTPP